MTLKQGLKHIMDNYLIAVDIETTGLNTDTDNIIEIAAIKFLNGEYVDKYVSYVNPMRKITEEITALTGITDNDVIFSPTISQIVEEVNQFIGNSPVVGHKIRLIYIKSRENSYQ
jgi:DNA polymerase-3 subunit alpha (Gram-positive type)